MKMNPVLKKLHQDNREFVTSVEIKRYCARFKINYENTIRNLSSKGYLLRIFKGVFYIKSFDEVKLDKLKYSHLELVSNGMNLLDINEWYFCLFTALKLNNMTHEYFTIDHAASNVLFRGKPITIAGRKFKFYKLKPDLMTFGIKREGAIRYSDPEKTILDFTYIWRYNGLPKNKIQINLSEYIPHVSSDIIKKYFDYYPKSVRQTVESIL
jgi:hypothetical protein